MRIVYPDFFNKFKCIASQCSDSCCMGWEVDIDPFTMNIYENTKGDFGERLQENICREETDHFSLKGDRCPFLNGDNLCDIYINMGEESLCDICSQHPRFYEWFGDTTEKGLGLCCEEAGRLLFSKKESLRFLYEENDDPNEDMEIDEKLLDDLRRVRGKLFDMLRDRSLPVKKRAAVLIDGAYNIQKAMDMGEEIPEDIFRPISAPVCSPEDTALKFAEFYLSLESMDSLWQPTLRDAVGDISHVLQNEKEFSKKYGCRDYEYEHLLVYLVYRYFLKAVFDGDVMDKITLAVSAFVMIHLCDIKMYMNKGDYTLKDRINIVKGFSKDVEYSEENLDAFSSDSCPELYMLKSLLL